MARVEANRRHTLCNAIGPSKGYLCFRRWLKGAHQYRVANRSIEVGVQSTKVACNTMARFLVSKAVRGMPTSFFNWTGSVTKSAAARVPQVVIPETEISGLPVFESKCLVTSKYSSGGGTPG